MDEIILEMLFFTIFKMPMRHLNRDLRKLYESGSGVQQKGLGQRSKFGENWYSNSQG